MIRPYSTVFCARRAPTRQRHICPWGWFVVRPEVRVSELEDSRERPVCLRSAPAGGASIG
jgi:hypothetical protein